MSFCLGYITASTKKEAEEIVLELLERELIACANILPGSTSYYVWEDALQKSSEVIIILKTQEKYEKEIIVVVKKMHSYECPCIIFLPITEGNPDYLKWIGSVC